MFSKSLFGALFLVATLPLANGQATLTVRPDGNGDYATIQEAVNAANSGDTVLLTTGVFTGAGNKDVLVTGKELTIRGQGDAESCIIDCQGIGRGFLFQGPGVTSATILQAVTIRNGKATLFPFPSNMEGGGLLCKNSSPTVLGCIFEANFADSGGGVSGDHDSILRLSGCRFVANAAVFNGGGVLAGGEATITECDFERNEAVSSAVASHGGGLAISGGFIQFPPVFVSQCNFRGNSSSIGGGICVLGESAGEITLDRCTLMDNEAITLITVAAGALDYRPVTGRGFKITNSLIARNTSRTDAGGICGEPAIIQNCTVVENVNLSGSSGVGARPGGIRSGRTSSPTIILNSVVRDNESNASTLLEQQVRGAFSTRGYSLLYSNVEGISGSPTNFDLDPLFVDSGNGNYHLRPGSPCVDAGICFDELNFQSDLDDQPRVQAFTVDIGADELPAIHDRNVQRQVGLYSARR